MVIRIIVGIVFGIVVRISIGIIIRSVIRVIIIIVFIIVIVRIVRIVRIVIVEVGVGGCAVTIPFFETAIISSPSCNWMRFVLLITVDPMQE